MANINVVCMASHIDVFILCVIVLLFVIYFIVRLYFTIFEMVNCTSIPD